MCLYAFATLLFTLSVNFIISGGRLFHKPAAKKANYS